jgi:outer membrane protein TolC
VTTRTIAGVFLLAAVAGAGALSAEGARATLPDPELDALVAEAIAKSPEIAAASSDAEAARQRIAPARTLPDPSLSLQYQNDGTAFSLGEEDMTFLGAMYSQPLPWPGKLKLAGEEAEKRAERVEAEDVGRARLAIEARVRAAYWDLLLEGSRLNLVEDRRTAWKQIEGVARERYAAGLGVQQDVLRAQVELLRLDEIRAERLAAAAVRLAEVNRLLRRPADSPLDAARTLELRTALPDLATVLSGVRAKSPELAGAGRSIEAARLRVDLARKDFYPDFTASGGPMYRGGLDPMWQVGLGITLPVFSGSRQAPRLAAATAEKRSEESRAESIGLELDLRTRERFENLKAAIEVARLYREGILPVDRLSLEAAVASYRTGKVPFVTVLEALNALYADREASLARIAETERWRAAIDEADPASGGAMASAVRSGPSMGAGTATAPAASTSTPGSAAPAAMGMR